MAPPTDQSVLLENDITFPERVCGPSICLLNCDLNMIEGLIQLQVSKLTSFNPV